MKWLSFSIEMIVQLFNWYSTFSRCAADYDIAFRTLWYKDFNFLAEEDVEIEVVEEVHVVKEEVVEQVDHLERRAGGRQRREAHDVAEVDGHRLERLGYHRLALDQIVGHGPANATRRHSNILDCPLWYSLPAICRW